MNYNPFETPFASGELTSHQGYDMFILDKPLEEGVYLFQINEDDKESGDSSHYTGIIRIAKYTNKQNSSYYDYYGAVYNFVVNFNGDLNKTMDKDDAKKLMLLTVNNYSIDYAVFSYTIQLYKII